jgi:hypothetical protein
MKSFPVETPRPPNFPQDFHSPDPNSIQPLSHPNASGLIQSTYAKWNLCGKLKKITHRLHFGYCQGGFRSAKREKVRESGSVPQGHLIRAVRFVASDSWRPIRWRPIRARLIRAVRFVVEGSSWKSGASAPRQAHETNLGFSPRRNRRFVTDFPCPQLTRR